MMIFVEEVILNYSPPKLSVGHFGVHLLYTMSNQQKWHQRTKEIDRMKCIPLKSLICHQHSRPKLIPELVIK